MKSRWGEIEQPQETNGEIMIQEPKILETRENIIYFYSEIDRAQILTLNSALKSLSTDLIYQQLVKDMDYKIPIYLHINSFGGSVFSGIAGMDQILLLKKKNPIITIVDGCCCSAATFLSVAGTRRMIHKHAYMMIHQLTSSVWGKYEEFKDEVENMDSLMGMMKGLYKEFTKVPMKKLDEVLKHDLFFDAKTCLEYGLVDEIVE